MKKPISITGIMIMLLLMAFIDPLPGIGQSHEMSVETGFGFFEYSKSGTTLLIPGTNAFKIEDPGNIYRIGAHYYFTPEDWNASVKSGLSFVRKQDGNSSLNFLQVPLGMDFAVGGKMKFFFGTGFYFSYLIAYSGYSKVSDFEELRYNFQVGLSLNLGVSYQITPSYTLGFSLNHNFDRSKLWADDLISPGGNPYTLKYKGAESYVNILLKYNLAGPQ